MGNNKLSLKTKKTFAPRNQKRRFVREKGEITENKGDGGGGQRKREENNGFFCINSHFPFIFSKFILLDLSNLHFLP